MGVKIPPPFGGHGCGKFYDDVTRAQTEALDAAGEYYMCTLDPNDEIVKKELQMLRDEQMLRDAERYRKLGSEFENGAAKTAQKLDAQDPDEKHK